MAAVGIGLFGGAVTMIFAKSVVFADPLRENQKSGCCGVRRCLGQTTMVVLARCGTG